MEKMAKYGNFTTHYEFPLGFKLEPNADMTYTGVRTAIISSVRFIILDKAKLVPWKEHLRDESASLWKTIKEPKFQRPVRLRLLNTIRLLEANLQQN